MSNEVEASYHYQITIPQIEIVAPDGSSAAPAVLYQAMHDKDAEVQVRAALGLAKLGDFSPVVINLLFNAADWRSHPEAGSRARYGIVELGKTNLAIIDRLLAALQHQKRKLSGVAECLGAIGQATPAVINGLFAFLQRNQVADRYAVVSAARSLLQLGYEDDALIDQLISLQKRGDTIVRSVAFEALGLVKQPQPKVIDVLLAALQQGGYAASVAARSLAQIGPENPQVIEALLQASGAEDWQVCGAALESLGAIPNPTPAILDAFCNALLDQERFGRRQAIEGLGKLSRATPKVIDSLLTLLAAEERKENNSQSLRGTIAFTLAQLGCMNDAVSAAFLAELRSDDASVRERAARNWWLLGDSDPSTLALLQSVLQDESEMVRKRAAASLKQLRQSTS